MVPQRMRSLARSRITPHQYYTTTVSGLPEDVTADELKTFFSKCGLILPDFKTGKPRIKIYTAQAPTNHTQRPKGDALVSFFRPESVALAVTLLDDTELRPNVRVKVEKVRSQVGSPRITDHHHHRRRRARSVDGRTLSFIPSMTLPVLHFRHPTNQPTNQPTHHQATFQDKQDKQSAADKYDPSKSQFQRRADKKKMQNQIRKMER